MADSPIHDEPTKILKLPDGVINLIAAGEVIQRPANAVKELIENSLDAKATEIRITVKNGGLKFLQVQDNGIGIRSGDLELLCHRYTTSKLREFDDLKSIGTYGFRGEALASISQVSHLTILTKSSSTIYGFRAQYEGGLLKEKPKPCACNKGTQITAEDLFYNMDDRRHALKSPGEETKKIFDVVAKYAVHNARVSFTLKKHGEAMLDLRTAGSGASASNSCTIRSAIGLVYGLPLARELLHFRCVDAPSSLAFTAEGYASNPGYSTKKYTFILFINNRLVECATLKKAIESLYTTYGTKSVSPFVYVKMEIEPQNVDVNVHPTKRSIQFLHEKEIIDCVEAAIKKTLDSSNVSKTFMVMDLPLASSQMDVDAVAPAQDQSNENKDQGETGTSSQKKPHTMVRTDGRERKLDEFLDTQRPPPSQNIRVNFLALDAEKESSDEPNVSVQVAQIGDAEAVDVRRSSRVTDDEVTVLYEEETRQPRWRPISLASVVKLQQAVLGRSSTVWRSFIAEHTFVGCQDPEYALLQYKTGLYVVNTTKLSRELFYQIMLFQFGNFGALTLNEKCRLVDLICLGMPTDSEQPTTSKRDQVHAYANLLMTKSEMLWDYFSLQLVDGYLVSIPWLLDKYVPQLEGLPSYIYRLATAVVWDDEEKCFDTFCRETSRFYAFSKRGCVSSADWEATLETVLYPAMKSKLIVPGSFGDTNSIMKVTDVHDLYRVFERC